jgi:ANTAR domain/PAS fold
LVGSPAGRTTESTSPKRFAPVAPLSAENATVDSLSRAVAAELLAGLSFDMAQTSPIDESASRGELGTSTADHATIHDTSLPTGQFRFYFADELWEWSPETARIHGYPAAEMRPTTAQVMSHKHPEDLARMTAVLTRVRHTREALSTRHRIIDVYGNTHDIVAVGRQLQDRDGNVIGNEGFYIDVTPAGPVTAGAGHEHGYVVTQKLSDIVEGRTVIDEVKGMLMLVYGIDELRAFELLRWRSMETNTKVRTLAEQLRKEFSALARDTVPPRSVFDGVLLTAHQRIGPPPTG